MLAQRIAFQCEIFRFNIKSNIWFVFTLFNFWIFVGLIFICRSSVSDSFLVCILMAYALCIRPLTNPCLKLPIRFTFWDLFWMSYPVRCTSVSTVVSSWSSLVSNIAIHLCAFVHILSFLFPFFFLFLFFGGLSMAIPQIVQCNKNSFLSLPSTTVQSHSFQAKKVQQWNGMKPSK